MNGPRKTRTALDPAPGSETRSVSQNRIDNADDVIHGLPDVWSGRRALVRFSLRVQLVDAAPTGLAKESWDAHAVM
jgi:hypothetical protein